MGRNVRNVVVSVFLVVSTVLSITCTGFASSSEAKWAAEQLYSMGMFKGVGTNPDGTPNFDLDRAPNRYEAVTMLVRLLGKEDEATKGQWKTPFKDVAAWAKPYVGYAYTNGLTSGVSAKSFGGTAQVSAAQYITFVLRALGYSSDTDFEWNRSWELGDSVGITKGKYRANTEFTRGDVAIISRNALDARVKSSNFTLMEMLKRVSVYEYLKDIALTEGTLSSSGDYLYPVDRTANEYYLVRYTPSTDKVFLNLYVKNDDGSTYYFTLLIPKVISTTYSGGASFTDAGGKEVIGLFTVNASTLRNDTGLKFNDGYNGTDSSEKEYHEYITHPAIKSLLMVIYADLLYSAQYTMADIGMAK